MACTRPLVRFQISQVSTVPKRISPRCALSRAPGTCSRIQAILVALKYASGTSPVRSRISSSYPSVFSCSIISEVLRHCQTMALYTGSPVVLSQQIVVSLWLVMPMPAISSAPAPTMAMASVATASWEDQISRGLCSTQPGRG